MMRTQLLHAFDGGPAFSLAPLGLASRFHLWRGKSGRKVMTTVYRADDDLPHGAGVAVLVRRCADGTRIPLAVGAMDVMAISRRMREVAADEVHLHMLADTPDAIGAVLADLASVVVQPVAA